MSEQRLNEANVRAALEQMGPKAVAKRMQRDRLAQPRGFGGLLEQPAELTRGQRLMMTGTWKQPALFWREGGIIIRGRPYLPQIGRASCRERVKISVGGGDVIGR